MMIFKVRLLKREEIRTRSERKSEPGTRGNQNQGMSHFGWREEDSPDLENT